MNEQETDVLGHIRLLCSNGCHFQTMEGMTSCSFDVINIVVSTLPVPNF